MSGASVSCFCVDITNTKRQVMRFSILFFIILMKSLGGGGNLLSVNNNCLNPTSQISNEPKEPDEPLSNEKSEGASLHFIASRFQFSGLEW